MLDLTGGRWIACAALHQVYRADAIAGKPTPTLDCGLFSVLSGKS
jgi:hypothetical protein